MNTVNLNPFRALWKRGYDRLLCVIPPDAPIREAGKRPGLKGPSGWYGVSVKTFDAAEEKLDVWHGWGGGAGIRCDGKFLAIDIDTLSPEWSDKIRKAALKHLGPAPLRIGRAPKALLVYKAAGPIDYRQVRFNDGVDENNPGLVECLSGADGTKWFVAHGIHPMTKQPYRWPDGLPDADTLTSVTAGQIAEFFDRLRAELPRAKGANSTSTDRQAVDQNALKGNLDLIAAAMDALPNDRSIFGYEQWVQIAAALRGACQDDPDFGMDLFCEFSERAGIEDPTEDPARVYKSIQPPFGLGAKFLFGLAMRHGDSSTFNPALVHFDNEDEKPHVETAADIFNEASKKEAEREQEEALPPIKWVRPSEWRGVEPPPREWEVEGWIPKGEVTLLYGDGGIGKTLVIHQYATAAAAGVDWLGQPTRKARVMCFFCEDSEEELLRRQIDINNSMMLDFDDIDENLRIASRKYMDNLFILWDRNTGAMKRQVVWDQLLKDARAFKADVIVVDTIADTYGGSEIDRGQVNAFVKSCLGRLAKEIGGSVIALGHPSMAGKASGSGTSGSTAWSNAARSRLFLRYPKGVEKGNVRELEGMKLNYGPKGSVLKLRWERGAFSLIASSTVAPSQNLAKSFLTDEAAMVSAARPVSAEGLGLPAGSIEAVAVDCVIAALRACEGVQMTLAPNSPHYAGRVLARREAGLLEALSGDDVENALRILEREGALSPVEVGRKSNRHAVMGLRVPDTLSTNKAASDDIFG